MFSGPTKSTIFRTKSFLSAVKGVFVYFIFTTTQAHSLLSNFGLFLTKTNHKKAKHRKDRII